MAIFPVSLGKNRISQGVEDWGSLISVPWALKAQNSGVPGKVKRPANRQFRIQVNGGQSWLSPPLLMAPKHCETSIFGAMIVPEREILEPH